MSDEVQTQEPASQTSPITDADLDRAAESAGETKTAVESTKSETTPIVSETDEAT